MPFAKRIIGEARYDGPQFGKNGDHTTETCEAWFQNDAWIFFRQLESLVYQADDLFSELYTECCGLVGRTRKVRDRVKALTEVALRLNAKEATIPEGSLTTPLDSIVQHHTTYGYECRLFTPSDRPPCVERLHSSCDVNPVHVIRQCNNFRFDGKNASAIFSMNPTLATSCTSFEVIQPHKTSIAQRVTRPLREPQCTTERQEAVAQSGGVTSEENRSATGDRIRLLSQSQPILIVSVDVSGAAFRQMSDRRRTRSQSQRDLGTPAASRASLKRPSRRHRGSAGCLGMGTSLEVEEFGFGGVRPSEELWMQSPSKERWQSARATTDPRPARRRLRSLKQRSKTKSKDESSSGFCSWRKSLCSMFRPSKEDFDDLWIEGEPETREPVTEDNSLPFTRSQSLPRSFRSAPRKGTLVGARSLTAVRASNTPSDSEPHPNSSRTLPNARRMGIPSPERTPSTFSGSLNRSRSLRMSQRSRSLERGAIEVVPSDGSVVAAHPGVSEAGACREVIVHLPEQPWTKPFATVKLRTQSTKVEAEGYQTSSGNWSVDSACHSMHSDQVTVLLPPGVGGERHPRHSLDKDSAISDLNHSDRLSTSSMHLVLAPSSTNHLESSSCSESSSTRSAVARSRRRRPNSSVTRVAVDDFWLFDDKTSLYSLDQDGFYTSMHADSGLSRSSHTLTPGDGVESLSDRTESVSSWDGKVVDCEEEEDDDSKTVIFDDWIPSTTKRKPVSGMGETGSVLEREGVASAEGGFEVPQDAGRCSEILLKQFASDYNKKSAGFPSFCSITRGSSEVDDVSFRGSLENDDLGDSLMPARLSFGNSQDTLNKADDAHTVSVELPRNSGNGVNFSLPSCDGKLENPSVELNEKREDIGIKCRQMSESVLESEDADGSAAWLISPASNTLNSVKGILKSKKKGPFIHSKSINFGPITSLDEILKAKTTPLTIGSSSEDVKSVTSYGIPVFSGSSFLGKEVRGEKKSKKDRGNKESEAETKLSNAVGVLPLKYKPVIVVKPKHRVKSSDVAISRVHSSNEVMTGYGCLGRDAISSCAGTATVDVRMASEDLTPAKKTNLTPVSAKLVITSPVVERTAYVENPHKRSLCTPLTPQGLQQHAGYNDAESWYNTLPRKSSTRKKIAIPGGDILTLPKARLPDYNSLRPSKKETHVERTPESGQENDPVSPNLDEVGNTDCFAMNLTSSGTIKRATTLARGVAVVPTLPETHSAAHQNALLSQKASDSSTLSRSNRSSNVRSAAAKISHASLDRNSLRLRDGSFDSRETLSNGVSWKPTSLGIKNSSKNKALETGLSNNAPHESAKLISSQAVEQPKALYSISAMSKYSKNQTVDQQEAFDSISLPSRFMSGKEGQVCKSGEIRNNPNLLVRTFSSSSSDSSPDVVSSCDASSFTISSTRFARSQESISSILSASEQNHVAKVTFTSPQFSDFQNSKISLETPDPLSRHTIGKPDPNSTSLSPANPKSTETQANSGDPDKNSSSTSMEPPSNSIESQSSASQKQSFESDSSELGSSVSGSPTTSPESDVTRLPSSTAFPGLGLSGCVSQSSASPDVIPLIARSDYRSPAKKSKVALASQNARSKQTAV